MKNKILITCPNSEGGVTHYFKTMRPHFKKNVKYYYIGTEKPTTGIHKKIMTTGIAGGLHIVR